MKLEKTVSEQFQNCFETVLFQFHFVVRRVLVSKGKIAPHKKPEVGGKIARAGCNQDICSEVNRLR